MIDCTDIYNEETTKSINTLKKLREAWLTFNTTWNVELFQFGDDDFYFYRFIVERQQQASGKLLTNILYRVMDRYGIPFEAPEEAPFKFILCKDEGRIGYRFEDFYADEDLNDILNYYKLNKAIIIRTWKEGKADAWISSSNRKYLDNEIRLEEVSIHQFFKDKFGIEEYIAFNTAINEYLKEARDVTGYQSIKYLSSMNLAKRKMFEEKILNEWDYANYKYQIIDPEREEIQNYLYILRKNKVFDDLNEMMNIYVDGQLYRAMIGANEYAESFITSEWLYYSLKGRSNFDYTSVISGYLKSVEQLLYQIIMFNIDSNCKIQMKSNMLKMAYENGVPVFERRDRKWVPLPPNKEGTSYVYSKHPYIDFITEQVGYMDSSIGAFEYFMRFNPRIFYNPRHAKTIADMVSCFRTECRNGFFHTHNLHKWNKVDMTRNNAIYLYFVLLGSCIIPEEKKDELRIQCLDSFDNLCKRIRNFRHYNVNFIFEYEDGLEKKMIYDFINNTVEYTDNGVEHYEKLLFYEVSEFEGALEQLDVCINEEQKVYLTRDNLPLKVIGVHRDGRLEEIPF